MESLSEFEGACLVVGDVTCRVDVWNQVVLFNVNRKDLTTSVDHDHTVGGGVSGGNEAELIGDLLSVQKTCGRNFVHIQETEFGDNEDNTELWAILHQYWEISVLLHLDIC